MLLALASLGLFLLVILIILHKPTQEVYFTRSVLKKKKWQNVLQAASVNKEEVEDILICMDRKDQKGVRHRLGIFYLRERRSIFIHNWEVKEGNSLTEFCVWNLASQKGPKGVSELFHKLTEEEKFLLGIVS